jgi:decaprenylphospho-beta-D-erythro-pentofuranosid-2-ulose 2-reductase
MKRVLLIGATSAIARAIAELYASRQAALFLMGRGSERLQTLAAHATLLGATVAGTFDLDLRDPARVIACVDAAHKALGGFDVVLIAQGILPDQAICERDPHAAVESLEVNYQSVLVAALAVASRLDGGTLAVLSSVAGDRGRRSNYVYASAKAAVDALCEGLRHRGLRVLTVKPGFVDTPMTVHVPKGPLFASPAAVARDIVRAIERGQRVLYTPFFWRWIMLVIRLLPRAIFYRTKL